jgi:diaminohydroxyphosphoribosylaminopyrimidine deaminase/5-amino-6-(5-phosphoribosylamino)uracil reductase
MMRCLDLAKMGAGYVSPNPLVGSVIVSESGHLLGEGYHARYGGPHAEVEAIRQVEGTVGAEELSKATLYVNLEPCTHHGKTPPCTDLIIKKGIQHVVVGMSDPFPEVAGNGIIRLRQAGVAVTVGALEPACKRLNEAYLHHLRSGNPLVTLKVATSLDGRVATASGDARWISGREARRMVHRWRAASDGILIGSSTARRDDPALTVRHVDGPQPLRYVLDREGSLPENLQLFTDVYVPRTCAIVGRDRLPSYESHLVKKGGRLLRLPERGNHIDLSELLHALGQSAETERGPLQSLFVEAGPRLATALLRKDLVDRYFHFLAPKLIGEGIQVLDDLSVIDLDDAHVFEEHNWEQVGSDILFRGYRRIL